MSHRASHWLATLPASAIGAGAFRVLFHLCDAHNALREPERACFPSQAALMEATGLSNGGLNKALNVIEAAGLIRRIRSVRPGTVERRTYFVLGCDMAPVEARNPPDREVSKLHFREQTPQSGDRANSTSEGGKLHFEGGANSTPVERNQEGTRKEPVISSGKSKSDSSKWSFSDGWKPSRALREWARSEGFSASEIDRQTESCVDHNLAAGNSFADLDRVAVTPAFSSI